ncbi:MAG TPA: MmcQ/YjbR family DNA-binding protein [Mucilaginibacter sp.]|nr:MmcQ/YjbR family DNA-binding protein [Mucilaginibacter sp.]
MVNLEQIRTIALELPGVTESLHFRLPTFKAGDKGFITVQKDAAIMALPEKLSKLLSGEEPEKFELVHRNKNYFIGLKVNLQQSTITDLKPLILQAYEYRKSAKK